MFEYNGAKVSCRAFTIADDDAMIRFTARLPEGSIINSGTPFAEWVFGGTVEGGDFPVPSVTVHSTSAEIAVAYEAWIQLPRRFLALWRQEVVNAENPAPKASGSKTSTTG